MKIFIIGTAYPYRGGLAAYNERLARQFVAEGNDVTVLTFSLQYPGFLFPGKTQFINGPPPEGLNIIRKINSVNPFNWISAGRRLRKEKPDILVFKYWLPFMAPCFGTIARIARRNRHTRVICIFDNVIPHEKRPGDRQMTRYFTSAIDGAVAMSESVLSDLHGFRQDIPVKLSPHPLFDNFGSPISKADAVRKLGLDADKPYVLFFGFVRGYKGLDLLLKAFTDEKIRALGLRLIVAGEFYEDEKPYRDIVSNNKISDIVFFFNRFINDSEVSVFFSAADLVVQPYKSATQSGVTQIAYHFIKPMVVTDVGGLREIVPDGKCGYVVRPEPQEIAGAIADFFEKGRMEIFRDNIVVEKKKYSWDKMTSSLLEIYRNCTGNDNKE